MQQINLSHGKIITLKSVKAHDPKRKMLGWEKISSQIVSNIWIQNTLRVDVDAALKKPHHAKGGRS